MADPVIISTYKQPSRKLRLQTCLCSDIDNEQFFHISSQELSQGTGLQEDYSLAIFKSEPTSYYNCHGMTFACRRTGIYEDAVIMKILQEDNYLEIKEEKQVLPGDVIVYYEDNKVTHSGIVIHVEQRNNDLPNVNVISKWAKYKEVIHNANYSPYSNGVKKYYRINHGFKII